MTLQHWHAWPAIALQPARYASVQYNLTGLLACTSVCPALLHIPPARHVCEAMSPTPLHFHWLNLCSHEHSMHTDDNTNTTTNLA